jgi:hypothetical protein
MRKKAMTMTVGMVMVLVMGLVGSVWADSASSLLGDTDVQLDFEVIIPNVVYFRVGNAVAGNIDTVTLQDDNFDFLDGSGFTGSIDVELISTSGDVNIAASGGNLQDLSTSDTIPFTDITVTSSVITAPAFGATVLSGVGGAVVNATDTWNFAYAWTTADPPPGGVYVGTVTYTVTVP